MKRSKQRIAVYRAGQDIFMLLSISISVILLICLAYLADPSVSSEDKADDDNSLIIEAYWTDGTNDDVDLWILDPTGAKIGYSNKNGELTDILRDDVGSDITGKNSEIAFTRGIMPGNYVVNLHYYRGPEEMPAYIVVTLKKAGKIQRLFRVDDVLAPKAEVTMARFSISQDGTWDGNYTRLPTPVRNQ